MIRNNTVYRNIIVYPIDRGRGSVWRKCADWDIGTAGTLIPIIYPITGIVGIDFSYIWLYKMNETIVRAIYGSNLCRL